MVGAGVWMGWYIQKVFGGTSSHVVASKSSPSLIVQVSTRMFTATRVNRSNLLHTDRTELTATPFLTLAS